MKIEYTRESLVKRYYSLKGTSEMPKLNALITDIEKYIPEVGSDKELEYLLLALKAIKSDYYESKFDKCCEIVLPIFESLQDVRNLSFFGISILAQVVHYDADYSRSITLAHEITDTLKKEHSHERSYLGVTFVVVENMTMRLLRAKYSTTTAKHKEIDAQFSHFLGIAIDMSVKYNLPANKAVFLVRDGVYNANYDQIRENLAWLHKAPGESRRYKTTIDEIGEYVQHLEDDKIGGALLNCLIGFHIKKQRELLNLTQEDIADALETDRNVINQIERGETGTSHDRLAKLRKILGVDYNYFIFGHIDNEPTEEDLLIQKIRLKLRDVPIEHIQAGLDYMLDCIKAMSELSTKGKEE